ncbi:hypothetical protein BDQ17DRAFT_1486462 [Cyathus striatus]|nr:hypothetical protein BDQ17DRAFT_1486462 [Cyathus striatus]
MPSASIPVSHNLLQRSVKVLIYAGNLDWIYNWVGNEAWTAEKSHQQLPDNVPTELVAEIFNLACEDYKIHVRNAIDEIELVTKPTDAVVIYHGRREYIVNPGTISQVCRSWKDIAYNTPMLWDTVFVDMGHIGIMHPHVMAEVSTKLKMWLDRASKSPLTVKIEGADVVAKQLFEYADQWKRIDLYCLGNHPELLSIALFMFRSFPVSISHSGINVCKWDRVGAFNIISNLQEMESIKDCSIYSPGMRIIQPPLSPAIRLSLLENLALHSLLVSAYEYILPSLELPALRRFTFSNFKEKRLPSTGTMNPIKPLFLMLQRSGFPNIQYLDLNISAPFIDAKELLDILRAVPALEHFKFASKPFAGITSSSVRMTKGAEPVVLNSLTSCHIDLSSLGDDRDGNSALFKYITLPALKEFRVALPVRKEVKSDRTPNLQTRSVRSAATFLLSLTIP